MKSVIRVLLNVVCVSSLTLNEAGIHARSSQIPRIQHRPQGQMSHFEIGETLAELRKALQHEKHEIASETVALNLLQEGDTEGTGSVEESTTTTQTLSPQTAPGTTLATRTSNGVYTAWTQGGGGCHSAIAQQGFIRGFRVILDALLYKMLMNEPFNTNAYKTIKAPAFHTTSSGGTWMWAGMLLYQQWKNPTLDVLYGMEDLGAIANIVLGQIQHLDINQNFNAEEVAAQQFFSSDLIDVSLLQHLESVLAESWSIYFPGEDFATLWNMIGFQAYVDMLDDLIEAHASDTHWTSHLTEQRNIIKALVDSTSTTTTTTVALPAEGECGDCGNQCEVGNYVEDFYTRCIVDAECAGLGGSVYYGCLWFCNYLGGCEGKMHQAGLLDFDKKHNTTGYHRNLTAPPGFHDFQKTHLAKKKVVKKRTKSVVLADLQQVCDKVTHLILTEQIGGAKTPLNCYGADPLAERDLHGTCDLNSLVRLFSSSHTCITQRFQVTPLYYSYPDLVWQKYLAPNGCPRHAKFSILTTPPTWETYGIFRSVLKRDSFLTNYNWLPEPASKTVLTDVGVWQGPIVDTVAESSDAGTSFRVTTQHALQHFNCSEKTMLEYQTKVQLKRVNRTLNNAKDFITEANETLDAFKDGKLSYVAEDIRNAANAGLEDAVELAGGNTSNVGELYNYFIGRFEGDLMFDGLSVDNNAVTPVVKQMEVYLDGYQHDLDGLQYYLTVLMTGGFGSAEIDFWQVNQYFVSSMPRKFIPPQLGLDDVGIDFFCSEEFSLGYAPSINWVFELDFENNMVQDWCVSGWYKYMPPTGHECQNMYSRMQDTGILYSVLPTVKPNAYHGLHGEWNYTAISFSLMKKTVLSIDWLTLNAPQIAGNRKGDKFLEDFPEFPADSLSGIPLYYAFIMSNFMSTLGEIQEFCFSNDQDHHPFREWCLEDGGKMCPCDKMYLINEPDLPGYVFPVISR